MAERLTDRDRRFADEYLIDFDAKHAAIRAGYSESTARNAAAWIKADNPEKPKLRELIDRKMADLSRRTGITAERVLRELANVAFVNFDDVVGDDGKILPRAQRADLAAIAGYKVKDGETDEHEVKFHDKLRALELIGKHLGMFTENVRITNDVPNIVDDVPAGAPDPEKAAMNG